MKPPLLSKEPSAECQRPSARQGELHAPPVGKPDQRGNRESVAAGDREVQARRQRRSRLHSRIKSSRLFGQKTLRNRGDSGCLSN
jgi:hypothetical protein